MKSGAGPPESCFRPPPESSEKRTHTTRHDHSPSCSLRYWVCISHPSLFIVARSLSGPVVFSPARNEMSRSFSLRPLESRRFLVVFLMIQHASIASESMLFSMIHLISSVLHISKLISMHVVLSCVRMHHRKPSAKPWTKSRNWHPPPHQTHFL